jgi:Protein of unknown function (DUF1553)/Protein of unknown function (DUF1549)
MIRMARFTQPLLLALAISPMICGAEPEITQAQRDYWAFRPPVRPALPAVKHSDWIRTPIDAFILARIEANGLSPAPAADRLTWLRRVTFDLIGLPPTPDEQDRFLADQSPGAFETVVERLLASPHYGERWAQHWLDVVRYAETNGYEADGERPQAWRYRDYVVASFNRDKPYDHFLIEQVAGDELATGRDARKAAESLIAAGLHRCGPMHMVGGNTDPEVNRQEVLTEMVNGLGSAILGLTIGCARCHDHKFDPLSQADYYRLQAFFAGTKLRDADIASVEEKAESLRAGAAVQARLTPLRAKVSALEAPYRARLSEAKKKMLEPRYVAALDIPADKRNPEQKKLVEQANILLKITWDEVVAALSRDDRLKRQALRDEIHALEAQMPPSPAQAWTVGNDEKTPPTYVLKRGDAKSKAEQVTAAFPRVLSIEHRADQIHGERRLGSPSRTDLAKWLTRPDHPLTARVWANRVWQHHFGRGIVATANDFGARGARPTHPELLDWLATELVHSGWSTKRLHRLIVLSAAYRQSSKVQSTTVDPDNLLLGRMNRLRLEAEALRDAMLAAAGALNRRVGGPMVRVPLEKEVYDLIFTEDEPDGLWKTTPDARQHRRRSLYLYVKRNVRQPLLEAFDQPDTLNSCPVRPVSTFAPQALILMNGPLARAQAELFAVRLAPAEADARGLVERGFRIALGRPPREEEARVAREFLGAARGNEVIDFCLTLFNLNEFAYVD